MPRLCFSQGRQTVAPGAALSESVHATCFACVTPRLKQLLLFLSRVSVHGVSGSFFFFFSLLCSPVTLSGLPTQETSHPLWAEKAKPKKSVVHRGLPQACATLSSALHAPLSRRTVPPAVSSTTMHPKLYLHLRQ